jgi:hypothetical protein
MVSAGVMLYEIAVTRILSVVLWYHFAFLAVSLAMLGLGAPGVWIATRGVGTRALERNLALAAVLVPLSVVILFQFGGTLSWRAALATVCITAPMLAMGSAVCILLMRARGPAIGRMYGADLLGATAAALVVIPLMHIVPTPMIVAGAALLPATALIVIGRRLIGISLALAIASLLVWQAPLRLTYSKMYAESDLGLVYEKWTPTARLTVFRFPFWVQDPSSGFGWGMGAKHIPQRIDQMWLEQDGSAGTPITRLTGPVGKLEYLFDDVTSLGYQLAPASEVAVIGAGGGRDILTALATGARTVEGVELNPHIVDLVSNRFREYSGDPYHLPGVRAVVAEGRSFLTTTPRRYDLIQISLIDSWAATAAGAYALSENYLYTVEAYRLYWSRLRPGGMISTSRWILGTNALETIRLAHLVRTALELERVEHPERHIAIAQGSAVSTVLTSRVPFEGDRLNALASVCERRGFFLHWPRLSAYGDSMNIGYFLLHGPDTLRRYGLDLSPPRDDRPFFFHRISIFGAVDREGIRHLSENEQAVMLLRGLMLTVSVVALVLFFLPFVLRQALPRGRAFWRGSLYFGAIGLGFLLVEIPLVQMMVLYLGHPSHAVSVILASMLLGAGAGSLLSERVPLGAVGGWSPALPLILAAGILAIRSVIPATLGAPWLARAAIAGAMASSMGFVMGFAFPLGLRRFGDEAKAWFWAVNGACGVVASVCSVGLSMRFGFERVLWLAVGLYVAAVILFARRPGPDPA